MNLRDPAAHGASRRRQRGAAALLLILTLIVILTIVLAPRLTLWQVHDAAAGRGYQTLIDAKAAILAHAANPEAGYPDFAPGRRLGQISLTPDLPVSVATGFDGTSKMGLCATRTWVPGQALTDPMTSGPSARCFGRFPWLSYGLQGPSTRDDQLGEVPWMFLSANLVGGTGCPANLNPLLLSNVYTTGGCLQAVPFPWLNVVDDRGNLLSSEVAIVLILPGPPVNGAQRRISPTDLVPAAYLEGLTVMAGCPPPCVPGTYNNASYTVANGQPWTFVKGPPSTSLGPPPAYYQQPFAFNDRLIYITASEYFEAMEQRARLAAMATLSAFRKANNYLPYSGDNSPPAALVTNSCGARSRLGLLPDASATNCGGTLTYPLWYTAAGWGSYFIYAVDPGCVAGAAAPRCLAPSLRLGSGVTRYNAVLFSPGRAILNAPYAASKPAAQSPLGPPLGAPLGGKLADFLDSAANVGGPPFDAAGTPPTANYNDRMYGIP
jgi:hypothetical protein